MQSVNFGNVGEFLDYLPEDQRGVSEYLRELILGIVPGVREKLSYNVPYYAVRKNICFIWPGAVTWGRSETYEGVRLGFTQGNLLNDESGYLEKGERKQVYWKRMLEIDDIDEEIIVDLLLQAVKIDSAFKNK